MKQKIYDIPIWDAFQLESCECPICSIEKKCEEDFIEALFTEMVMDVRLNPQLVEDYDFCHHHFEKLYKYPDKFGLAILTNRILYSKRKHIKEFKNSSKNSNLSIKRIFTGKLKSKNSSQVKECLLCSKIEKDMDNYLETLIALWNKDDNFKRLYEGSKGFCILHYFAVLDLAEHTLKNGSAADMFKASTSSIQENNLERLQEELEWFISKFDYRFADEPWKTSKDALIRTIQKLIGNYNNKI